jgi:tetratricopeptide (TPR) repeat protein
MTLFPCLSAGDEKDAGEANIELSALAGGTREAVVVVADEAFRGVGAFISADGLALVHLQGLMGKNRPEVLVSGGKNPKFGKILGVFPEQELALVKIEHRPMTWLRLAPDEPEIGETVALVPLKPRDQWRTKVPPVIGRILAKRSDMTPNLREPRFVRVLSLGAGLSGSQRLALGPGCFAIDTRGRLVAFTGGISAESQARIHLSPVSTLAKEIERLAEGGVDLGHPLPLKHNPIDSASIDPDFHPMNLATSQGNLREALRLLGNLEQRYPKSFLLKFRRLALISMEMEAGNQGRPIPKIPKIDSKDPVVLRAATHDLRASIYQRRRQLKEAAGELEAIIRLSPNDYPGPRISLANLHAAEGRFGDAEKLLREVFALSSDTIYFVDLLKRVLLDQGKVHEAQEMSARVLQLEEIYRSEEEETLGSFREALAVAEKLHGPKDRELLDPLLNLGMALAGPEGNPEAEPFLERALALGRQSLGPDHDKIVLCLTNLATVAMKAGNLDEAEKLAAESLAMARRLHKVAHPSLLACLNIKMDIVYPQGNPAKVEPVLDELIEMRRVLKGPDYPELIDDLIALAQMSGVLGKLEKAEDLSQEALKLCRRGQPENQVMIANILTSLGSALRDQGQLAKARGHFQEAVDILRKLPGSEHDLAKALISRGTLASNEGKPQEAEAFFREGLKLNPIPSLKFNLLLRLGRTLAGQKEFPEAEAKLQTAIGNLEKAGGQASPQMVEVMDLLATVLTMQGKFVDSEPILRQLIELRKKLIGPNYPALVNDLMKLGQTSIQLARFANAGESLKEALTVQEKRLGPGHPAQATTKLWLARALRGQKMVPEAKRYFVEAIDIFKKRPEFEGALTTTLMELGVMLRLAGEVVEAERWIREALVVLNESPRPNPPLVVNALRVLAAILDDQEKFSDTEIELRKVIAILIAAKGQGVSLLPQVRNDLAGLLSKQAKHAEAEVEGRALVALIRALHGEKDLKVATVLNALALNLKEQNKLPEVETCLREVLEIGRAKLGEEHDAVGLAFLNLGVALNDLAKFAEAEKMLRRALGIARQVKGTNSEEAARVLTHLGSALGGQGRYADSEKPYREVLAIMITLTGEKNSEVARIRGSLAGALSEQDKLDGAEQEYLLALAVEVELHGRNTMVACGFLANLAEVLRKTGNLEKAEELLSEASQISVEQTGADHPAIENNLAKVRRDQKRFTDADPLFIRALTGVEKMRPPGHPDIAGVLVPYAESLEQQDKFAPAQLLVERALAIQEKALPAGHPDFKDTFELLGKIHAGLGNKKRAADFQARKKRITEAREGKD